MSDKFKIAVKAKGGHFEEGTAGAGITPGMAIELQADGNYDPGGDGPGRSPQRWA